MTRKPITLAELEQKIVERAREEATRPIVPPDPFKRQRPPGRARPRGRRYRQPDPARSIEP